MEEFLQRTRFCTELRDHRSMVSAPPVGSPSAENCFHVTSNMEFGWKALSFVDLSAKSVESPVTESLMLLSPPGLHWQHGAWQKVNAISVCVEPNWLTSGARYKADSALHAELLWELSQALLCLGKQIEKKNLEKVTVDVCFASMSHSSAVGLILKNHLLAVVMTQ